MTTESLRACDRVSNSWFDEFYDLESDLPRLFTQNSVGPKSETFVKENTFHLRVELKGIELKDVDIVLEDGCLTVTGKKRNRSRDNDDSYHIEKSSCETFIKTFHVPEGIDSERISVSYEGGVLEVTVPLPERETEKNISLTGKKDT